MMPMLSASPPAQEPRPRGDAADPIVIGLVNNMPDAALNTTERQFRQLLFASAHNSVRLRFFSLPELPRGEAGRSHIRQHYHDITDLWASYLHVLMLTG